jgi:hypothetical protein
MGFDHTRTNAIAYDTAGTGSPTRGLATLLFLVSVTAAFVLTAHNVRDNHAGARVAATLTHVVEQALPKPAVPSTFEQELAMRPSELMARWEPLIAEAAAEFHIPKNWIRAVMRMESGGRTMLGEGRPIVSSTGAIGLMQVMPQTYAEMRDQLGLGADPADAHDNIFAGAAYLRFLYRKYGNPAMFAAYNDGPGNLEDHLYRGAPLPAETRNYVKGIAGMLGKARGQESAVAADSITLTRPDGTPIQIARASVRSIRAALPGEYAGDVQAVVVMAKMKRQGVRESVAVATQAIGVL